MNKDIILEQTGLNKNEARAYQKFIEIGQLTPPQLGEAIRVSRENAYLIVKSLENLSLIERIPRYKKQIYRALPPEKLNSLIEEQRIVLQQKEKAIEAILPYLTNLYNLGGNHPSISSFEGVSEIKKLYENVFVERPTEVLTFQSPFDYKRFGGYLTKFLERRAEEGIRCRMIVTDKTIFKPGKDEKLLREIKIIDDKRLSLPSEISISNNKVTILSFRKDLVGFAIYNEDLADSLKKIFEFIWEEY
jgi:sugar-specific transcriptional regulator TrmB